MMSKFVPALLSAVAVIATPIVVRAEITSADRLVLPIKPKTFGGKIERTADTSRAQFPERPQPPKGAPNIILVMTDDVGFASTSTFGGLIPTPALDALASKGLRYNNFHTTAMCSPSRAALLTGRNAHAVGMGALSTLATGYPGYNGEIARSAATVGKVLTYNGYGTAFFGKHHNIPPSEMSAGGPFSNWPTGLGFEYYYGFLGSQSDQWVPALVRGTSRVEPPGDVHLDELLINDAIDWLHNQQGLAPEKPFFIYLAPGTAHAPLQAPKEWIAKFRGKFDQGWDKAREEIFARQRATGIIPKNAALTPRPDLVPAWQGLTAEQKAFASRAMEVYAAQLAFQDHQFGRLVDELKRMGKFENTLILFVEGDNGSSSEGGPVGTNNNGGRLSNGTPEDSAYLISQLDQLGGPNSHVHYPLGWAWAMNTPFQLFKRYASHLGGVRNGFVVSWPQRISRPGIRPQFEHLIDIVPTIYDAVGIPAPSNVEGTEQQPMHGASMLTTFGSDTVSPARHTQYFEMLGNQAIYQDGWWAATVPPVNLLDTTVGNKQLISPLNYKWNLYYLPDDFSQSKDVSEKYPDKLNELRNLFWKEAEQYQVLPIDNSLTRARAAAEPEARLPKRSRYTYWGARVELDRMNMAPILSRSYTLTADITIPSSGGSGVIAAVGNRFAGWSFYLKDGRPVAYQAFSEQPDHQFKVESSVAVPAGRHKVGYDVRYKETAVQVIVSVDGQPVAEGIFPYHIKIVDEGEAFTTGFDGGIPVSTEYEDGGKFNGIINSVQIELIDETPAGSRSVATK